MKNWRISSIRKQPNKSRFLCGLGLLVVLLALASLCFGAVPLTPEEILGAFLGGTRDSAASQIVLLARLPRTCGCLLAGAVFFLILWFKHRAGAALAVSGTVIQGVLDNPLASPNIIGVNSGAGLLVAVSCALFPNAVTLIPFTSILGAAGAVFLVLFLAERTGASRITLVLAGIAVSGIFSAGIDAVVTFVPEALNGYSDFRIGGLANLSMTRVAPAFWIILVAMLLVLSLSGELDVLLLGTETARSLGLPAKQLRLTLLALAAALAGAAVSFAGLLGFVGLMVPHIMRRLLGAESLPLLLASALGGASLLTLCDLLARLLFAPYELPVGIVLALAGGPFFIWLLLRQRGGRSHA